MSGTFASIATSARRTLLDVAGVTWTDADMIGYINEAIQQTCFVKPDAYTVQGNLTLVAGFQQELDQDSTGLVDVIANVVSGAVITQADKELLVESNRFYPAGPQAANIEHFTADVRNPRRFLVSPPAVAGITVVAVWGITPAPGDSLASPYPLPAAYAPSTTEYVLSKAFGKNSKRQDVTKEDYHYKRWATSLGLKAQAQTALTPRVT